VGLPNVLPECGNHTFDDAMGKSLAARLPIRTCVRGEIVAAGRQRRCETRFEGVEDAEGEVCGVGGGEEE
jgi:hypothetical protein